MKEMMGFWVSLINTFEAHKMNWEEWNEDFSPSPYCWWFHYFK